MTANVQENKSAKKIFFKCRVLDAVIEKLYL